VLLIAAGDQRAAAETPDPWSFLLSKKDTRVDAWLEDNPKADGRGVVIAILDTGIDPGTVGVGSDDKGKPRIQAMRDFSGQGRVTLERARLNKTLDLLEIDSGGVLGFPAGHDRGAPDRGRGVWLGFFKETRVGRDDARDLDGDGDTGDRFAVAVWVDAKTGNRVAAIDTNGDGNLADEVVRASWEDEPEAFVFGSRDARRTLAPLNFGLYVNEDAWEVEFVFDDGGHGTHCAGIAGGRGIAGKAGFDGVAPGVEFLALKIGDNRLAGGATTDGAMIAAVRYASAWARQHDRPVVINLSYGIGARAEGASTIAALIDKELAANPRLLAAVSAGNEGPGLSTVGTPGDADLVWTAGALLPAEQAAAIYGAPEPKGRRRSRDLGPTLFGFSSRGGEIAKPDGLTPGVAWSTAPPFARRNVMAGTSMASPHAAGIIALLVGRANAAGLGWTPFDIKRSLIAGARLVAGLTYLDQGAGIIDIERAWEALRSVAKGARTPEKLVLGGYHVATPVPHRPGRHGSASLWRIGGLPRREADVVVFKITPVFYRNYDDATANNWFEEHRLDSDVSWARPTKARMVMRGATSADVQVRVDFGALAGKPGLHTALIRARTDAGYAFVLPIHVIVPDAFDGDAPLVTKGELKPGAVARVFVAMPAPVEGLDAVLSVAGPKELKATLAAFNADGDPVKDQQDPVTTDKDSVQTTTFDADELSDGVWELVVRAPVTNATPIRWELGLVARRMAAPKVIHLKVGADRLPTGSFDVINRHSVSFRGRVAVTVDGWSRTESLSLKGGSLTHSVAIGPGVDTLALTLEAPDETWLAVTDLAVTIRDDAGKEVFASAMSGPPLPIELNVATGTYRIEIQAARASTDAAKTLTMALTERHVLVDPMVFNTEGPGDSEDVRLYPGVLTPVQVDADTAFPFVPPAFQATGTLELKDDGDATWLRRRVAFILN